ITCFFLLSSTTSFTLMDRPHLSHFHSYLFFFNQPANTEIYTLSLHDALPICEFQYTEECIPEYLKRWWRENLIVSYILTALVFLDRKSTRLNSSHVSISYAVFCLKKKK